MSADENALTAMRRESNKASNACIVQQAADKLDAVQRATFEEAMFGAASDDITAAAIADHARDAWGWTMHTSSIRSHRRGACNCDKS
jgi:hypothetical protein